MRGGINLNTYKILNRFECCGKTMVTVIIRNKAACTMPERDYKRIITDERRFRRKID